LRGDWGKKIERRAVFVCDCECLGVLQTEVVFASPSGSGFNFLVDQQLSGQQEEQNNLGTFFWCLGFVIVVDLEIETMDEFLGCRLNKGLGPAWNVG
jgi:hypothetical protein